MSSDVVGEVKEQAMIAAETIKEDAVAAAKAQVSGLRSFVAGGVGGVCAVIVGMSLNHALPIYFSFFPLSLSSIELQCFGLLD